MNARLVVLDAAGTLVEVRGSVGAAYAALARAAGADLDPAMIQAGFTRAFTAAPPLAFGGLDAPLREEAERAWWRDVARSALEEAGPFPADFSFDLFFESAWRRFAAPEAWRVPDDVRPGLRALRRAGVRLAVFSNWDGRLDRLLDGLGLRGYFARIVVSSALPAAKPDLAAYQAARTALADLTADSRPVMVGDRIDYDVEPALAAGWDAVWIDRGGRGPTRRGAPLPEGAATLRDLRELAFHPLIANAVKRA